MKRILTILIFIVALYGCTEDSVESWSADTIATLDAITGEYSLISASWNSPIDLSGEGPATRDMLYQLESHGWCGIQSIKNQDETEFVSVLFRSDVLEPDSPLGKGQVNLYVPYPERDKDMNKEHPIVKSDRCNIEMNVYQFHYQVDGDGKIALTGVTDRRMCGDGGMLSNVKIRFEGNCIYLEAVTSYYDWASASWLDGKLRLIYEHN